ncbi:hypothetical protein P5673_012531 [Acropora cervicornis]|uniref:Uncharacterized protein n=1 Tax=Acropora cervicornis TaxID=6130 RepID=A0AAD9QNL4_ACRCE|nr:hypothetical protein P5673_012531 [Acropora cervicornis]
MTQTGQKQKKDEQSKIDSFIWTDDEVELLLKVTMEYKTSNAMENVARESTRTMYNDILKHFNEQYPSSENALSVGKDYPHKRGDLSKSVLMSKLKMIKKTVREAVDSGRKSRHGRVVLLYNDLCEETTTVERIEMTEINNGSSVSRESPNANDDSQTTSPLELEIEDDGGMSTDSTSTSTTSTCKDQIKERRNLLNARLKGHKDQKLKRKLPVDVQLLNVSQEELQVRKQLIKNGKYG